jgi:outer membrane protein assembly factor BamE (lipoprotein component of BamABCDE complex)
MKRSHLIIGFVVLCLVLIGCMGSYFKFDQVRQVTTGMTEDEVVKIMGKPMMVTASEGQVKWIYAYGTGLGTGASCSFVFSNKVVVSTPQVPDSFK